MNTCKIYTNFETPFTRDNVKVISNIIENGKKNYPMVETLIFLI